MSPNDANSGQPDDARLEKDEALRFCREVLLVEPRSAAVFLGLLPGSLDDDDVRQSLIQFLNSAGYLTSPETVADAIQEMRKSDVSVWRGAYEMFVDRKRGPRLGIAADGRVFLDRTEVKKPSYANDRLQWSSSEGNVTDGDLTFSLPRKAEALTATPSASPAASYSAGICQGRIAVPASAMGGPGDARGKVAVYSLAANQTDTGIDAVTTWACSYVISTDAWRETGVQLVVETTTEIVLLGGQRIYPATAPAAASWSSNNNLTWTGGYLGSSGNLTFLRSADGTPAVSGRIWFPPAAEPTTIGTCGESTVQSPALALSDCVGIYDCTATAGDTAYVAGDPLVVGVDAAGQPTAMLGTRVLAAVTYDRTSAVLAWQGTVDQSAARYRTVNGRVQFSFDPMKQAPRFAGTLWDHAANPQAPAAGNFAGSRLSASEGISAGPVLTVVGAVLAGLVVAAIGVYILCRDTKNAADVARDAAERAPADPELARRAAEAGEQEADAADAAGDAAGSAIVYIDISAAADAQPLRVDAAPLDWARDNAADAAAASLANLERQRDDAIRRLLDRQARLEALAPRVGLEWDVGNYQLAWPADEPEPRGGNFEIVSGYFEQSAEGLKDTQRFLDDVKGWAERRTENAAHATEAHPGPER